ncbi:tRNA1(Val) (adenine(37)-N6)-methyltransferase [Leminorella grimontii]|uniref:tRNA1(Val) (adenine(37)-N6)-methyltransferase n=1 Tax=Leminorella grimontii TaxID=82981 RepID=UPI00321FAB69
MKTEKGAIAHRRGGFTFKRFFVAHDRCGMKVTTDGILLGSWTAIGGSCRRVLDIGTGTGLLALMLAQRSGDDVVLDAVEIDDAAALQAQENAAASPWPQRIRVFRKDIKAFGQENPGGYEVIVSNPPYFEQGCECRDTPRAKARYTAALSHRDLLCCADALLAPQGAFSLILPVAQAASLQETAREIGWFVRRRAWVSHREGRSPYVTLLELVKTPCSTDETHLFIREPDGRSYTEAFKHLTRDFYLSF